MIRKSSIRGTFVLTVLLASAYAISFTRKYLPSQNASGETLSLRRATPEQAFSSKTEFGPFPPNTGAERELETMLHKSDEDIDLALANWLIVADVPEFQNMSRKDYFGLLDAMTERVRKDMAEMEARGWPNSDSDNPETRCRRFCSAIIALHFAYADEFREENLTPALMKGLYENPNNVFLAGLIRTKRGSCVSMPMIYLVIGRRLGMLVHLVAIGEHCFIRWEEPHFRMNIETTSTEKIAWTPDESVYLETEGITRDQLKGTDLQNLSAREVVGLLFHARSCYWHLKHRETQSCQDLARAYYLAPDDPNIKSAHDAIFKLYGIKPNQRALSLQTQNGRRLD